MLYRPKQASFQTKTSLLQKLRYTAAASEAHMNGCIMPVITNPGNENHEIVSSLAAIIYKRGKRSDKEQHYRTPALSHLLIIHQKTFIGILSAFCVAVSAMAATQNAPSHFLAGGSPAQKGSHQCARQCQRKHLRRRKSFLRSKNSAAPDTVITGHLSCNER